MRLRGTQPTLICRPQSCAETNSPRAYHTDPAELPAVGSCVCAGRSGVQASRLCALSVTRPACAGRLINPQTMMLGQEPRQTTSNLGHLHKPSIQALIHGLNRHYYSIAISYRWGPAQPPL